MAIRDLVYRPTRAFLLFLIPAALAAGCAAPAPRSTTLRAAPRYGPECAAARQRATSDPPPTELLPPSPTRILVPPRPIPEGVRGRTAVLQVRVDSAGTPLPGTERVSGITDGVYAAQLREGLLRFAFRPALLDGCGVAGTARVTIQL